MAFEQRTGNQQGVKVTTRALKLRSNYDDREKVLNQIVEALGKGEEDQSVNQSARQFLREGTGGFS